MECRSTCRLPKPRLPYPDPLLITRCSVNPSGIFTAGAAVAFLIAVPITTYITAPNGVFQSFVEATIRLVPGTANIPKDRIIPALSALYIFVTFGATGAASGAGQAMARENGLDNNRTSSLNVYFCDSVCLMNMIKFLAALRLISQCIQILARTFICSAASRSACAAHITT